MSWTGWHLLLVLSVPGCNSASYGVDWAVIGVIHAYHAWHAYFGFDTSGGTYGLINALMSIGTIYGAPFLSLSDIWGRRTVTFIGNLFVLVAALMQGLSTDLRLFMAVRFLLGFGSGIMTSSQYMGEISPTHLRGRLVGIVGACFQVGSLSMTAAMIGLSNISGNWSWRIPLLMVTIFPAITCLTIFFWSPETPRYYIMRGQREKAKEVIAKYHTTSGNIDEPLVEIVVSQIENSLETDTTRFKDFYDYRVFFTKGVRYRLLVLILHSIFQQWNGGGIISYYVSTL